MHDGELLRIPIAHGEGNYTVDAATLKEMESYGQIVFRYVDASGEVTTAANPNGSVSNIAGVCNREGNVFGMMPHPERAAETLLGSDHGKKLFDSLLSAA